MSSLFSRFANAIAHSAGKPITFCIASGGIIIWALTGPVFGFSETWQLVVNTTTSIITFLMVFVLQNSQNRDSEAIQAKLDQLILVSNAANTLVGAERLSEADLKRVHELIVAAAKRHNEREMPQGGR